MKLLTCMQQIIYKITFGIMYIFKRTMVIHSVSCSSRILRDSQIITDLKYINRTLGTLINETNFISSVLKLTIVEMKFSRMMTERIVFQSAGEVVPSPSRRHIDSKVVFTIAGGFAIERTSTKCCFLIDLTAVNNNYFIRSNKIHMPKSMY